MIEIDSAPTYLGPEAEELKFVAGPKQTKIHELPTTSVPIMAFDPGGTTGWSLLVVRAKIRTNEGNRVVEKPWYEATFREVMESKLSWVHGQVDCHNEDFAGFNMGRLISAWPSAAIVIEDFILRAERKEKSRELLSPVRIGAVLQHYAWSTGRKCFIQSPANAKTTATDDRLKLWSMYQPKGAMRHARDADRHVILFLRRVLGQSKDAETIRSMAWPHLFGEYHNGGRAKNVSKKSNEVKLG